MQNESPAPGIPDVPVTEPVSVDGVLDIPRTSGYNVKFDVSRRVLHILPKLMLIGEQFYALPSRAKAELKVSSEALARSGVNVMPAKGTKVRRPLPNRRYFVGGSKSLRYGWLVELPEDLHVLDLKFEWAVKMPGMHAPLLSTHLLTIQLASSNAKVFSMDPACWRNVFSYEDSNSMLKLTPYSILSTMGHRVERVEQLSVEQIDPLHIQMRESMSIPGIQASDLWSLHAFDVVKRVDSPIKDEIRDLNERHFGNACIAMPLDVFVRAVSLAKRVDFGPDSIFAGFAGSLESHPALQVMCGWWNHEAPDAATRCAKTASVFTRSELKAEYEGAAGDPPVSYDHFTATKAANATVDCTVLVAFTKGQDAVTAADGITHAELVSGDHVAFFKAPQGDLVSTIPDEAALALETLKQFPRRYQSLWKSLQRKSKERD